MSLTSHRGPFHAQLVSRRRAFARVKLVLPVLAVAMHSDGQDRRRIRPGRSLPLDENTVNNTDPLSCDPPRVAAAPSVQPVNSYDEP